MRVIVLSGKAQHGKDTIAKRLAETITERGDNVLVTHYADLLKHICTTLFDWNGEKDEGGRALLQYVGTDVIRKRRPDFWVDYMISILKIFKNEWDWVFIPDARFPNEIEKLRNAGFDVLHIRVERENFDNMLTANAKSHKSETALDDVKADFYIQNSGTLEEFLTTIDKFGKDVLFE